ncbi:MAG: NAD(P)-binding oxidoreductase, partial [Bacillota bacterium]
KRLLMKVLVLGASGATGRQAVSQLIKRGVSLRIVTRKNAVIPEEIRSNKLVEHITGNIAEFNKMENEALVSGCDAVICCLGHNITMKGIFGEPRLLVYQSIKNICEAIEGCSSKKIKLILMNTVACIDKEIKEERSLSERIILSILTVILPPQKDNVWAAGYLSRTIGKNNEKIEWTAVRPDSLINNDEVSPYEVVETVERNPIFNPGKTSRINVGHFMAELITDNDLWEQWKSKMPVIYNFAES